MLDCPLPIESLLLLTDFLRITDVSTKPLSNHAISRPVNEYAPTLALKPEIHELLASCEAAILRAENQTYLAEKLASIKVPEDPVAIPPAIGAAAPKSSSQYENAVSTALLKVLEERDKAHARMVAADVLHAHEMEQQRKKVLALEAKLESEVNHTDAPSLTSEAPKPQGLMQQDSDAELVALCQQLSTEISGRTSASLEVNRLKEARKIEQEHVDREKKDLLAEIERLRDLLAKERDKRRESEREVATWKLSFQEAINAREETASTRHSVP